MDHIPRSKNCAFSRTPIPYLSAGPQYDQRGFHGFFERHGMSMQDVINGDFNGLPEAQVACALQAFLYFAFLDELIGIGIEGNSEGLRPFSHVPKSDFIRADDQGRQYVTTKKLTHYLQTWRSCASSLPLRQRQENVKHIDKSLSFVNRIAFDYLNFKNPLHAGKWPLDDPTMMSILILYHTLSVFAYNLYPGLLDGKILDWPSSRFLNDKMREIGWCDSFISALNDGQSWDTIYFMTDLTWPPLSPMHERCTHQICRTEQIDIATYESKHVPQGYHGHFGGPDEPCDCPFLGPDEEKVLSIVRSGNVPIVTISMVLDGSTAHLDIRVQEINLLTNQQPYVAVSHVWSHGLGNPKDNALPQCQLFKLMQLVTDTQRDSETNFVSRLPFWIDTLCVPKDRTGKDLAIRSMRDIYAKATTVLVLDADIMQIRFRNGVLDYQPSSLRSSPRSRIREAKRQDYEYARAIEVFARICVSGWVRRLWTLQEATFASSLRIQFSDVSVPLTQSLYSIVRREVPTSASPFADHFEAIGLPLSELFGTFSLLLQERNISNRLAMIGQLIRGRSTSRWEDEYGCLATLLEFDVSEILEIDPNLRMKALLSKFEVLPRSIAFSTGPRLREPGWRWAPASLLGLSDGMLTGEAPCKTSRRESGGLFLETVGFIKSFHPGSTKHLSPFRGTSSKHEFFYGLSIDPRGSFFDASSAAAVEGETSNSKETAALNFLAKITQQKSPSKNRRQK